jgi:hypothetical protein
MAFCYLSQPHPFCSEVRSCRDTNPVRRWLTIASLEFLILSPQRGKRRCQSFLILHPFSAMGKAPTPPHIQTQKSTVSLLESMPNTA